MRECTRCGKMFEIIGRRKARSKRRLCYACNPIITLREANARNIPSRKSAIDEYFSRVNQLRMQVFGLRPIKRRRN